MPIQLSLWQHKVSKQGREISKAAGRQKQLKGDKRNLRETRVAVGRQAEAQGRETREAEGRETNKDLREGDKRS